MAEFKAIILAGGSGERFWPLSTPERPKQFLDVIGGKSLIRRCIERLDGLVEPRNVFVVTARSLLPITRRELPEIPRDNVVGEPMRRDTGAAVALGVAKAGEGVLGFFPSDQLVADPEGFRRAVRRAVRLADSTPAKRTGLPFPIVAIGIKPTYPAISYGYVNSRTGKFVEKPDAAKAKQCVDRGFLWNAGMFIGRAEAFRAAFAQYAPELESVAGLRSLRGLAKVYGRLPRISFDFAVMEKLPRVEVVAGDFGWDDVGSYAAFDQHFVPGADGNIAVGNVHAVESDGCTAVAKGAKIALLGVKNLVVVTTPDAVLVVAKDKVHELKKLFAK